MTDGRCPDVSAVDIRKMTQQRYRTCTVRMPMAGTYWRNLVNTTEPPMCGGDAAFCQIIFTTCCY